MLSFFCDSDHLVEKPLLVWSIPATSFESLLETGGASVHPSSSVTGRAESSASLRHVKPSLKRLRLVPGSSNSDYDLGRLPSSVTVTKASGKATCILIDLWGDCQRCQLFLLNCSSLFTFSESPSPSEDIARVHLFIIIWGGDNGKCGPRCSHRSHQDTCLMLGSFWVCYPCSGNRESVLWFIIPPVWWRRSL